MIVAQIDDVDFACASRRYAVTSPNFLMIHNDHAVGTRTVGWRGNRAGKY